jgi:nitroreductase
MELMQAIHNRRAVRSYNPSVVDEVTIQSLLAAAVRAPSALNAQPWRFAIVQDPRTLARYSALAKERSAARAHDPEVEQYSSQLHDPSFNIFYDAGTLIVICADTRDPWAEAACWLAAENLWLAATEHGLGACCVGLALGVLNEPAIKAELSIPPEMQAIAPLIVGWPASPVSPVERATPYVLSWQTPEYRVGHRD